MSSMGNSRKQSPEVSLKNCNSITVAESAIAFIGIENNADGQKLKELAIGAVQNAKK